MAGSPQAPNSGFVLRALGSHGRVLSRGGHGQICGVDTSMEMGGWDRGQGPIRGSNMALRGPAGLCGRRSERPLCPRMVAAWVTLARAQPSGSRSCWMTRSSGVESWGWVSWARALRASSLRLEVLYPKTMCSSQVQPGRPRRLPGRGGG